MTEAELMAASTTRELCACGEVVLGVPGAGPDVAVEQHRRSPVHRAWAAWREQLVGQAHPEPASTVDVEWLAAMLCDRSNHPGDAPCEHWQGMADYLVGHGVRTNVVAPGGR